MRRSQDVTEPKAKAALAPTGKLRVAFISPGVSSIPVKDPATGALKGLAPDLSTDLAQTQDPALQTTVLRS